jgi:hypothetical protein
MAVGDRYIPESVITYLRKQRLGETNNPDSPGIRVTFRRISYGELREPHAAVLPRWMDPASPHPMEGSCKGKAQVGTPCSSHVIIQTSPLMP